jgi:hypothetical protein
VLGVECAIPVLVDAMNLFAPAVRRLLLFGALVRLGITMRLGDIAGISLSAAHLAQTIKSVTRHK